MPNGVAASPYIRLLGPIELLIAGRPLALNGSRRKALLAILALHAGGVVSTERLIDVVWGDRPPATATNTLQRHVSYLRQLLGGTETIVARPPGYVLNLGPESTDVQAARRLIDLAGHCATPAERVGHLRAALALWHGQPLADVADWSRLDGFAEDLARLRLETERALVEARLSTGERSQLIGDLERLVRQHPLDEQLHGQLMVALYRTGRQVEAMAVFHRLRDALDENLGLCPGPELRDLQTAILRQDSAIGSPAARWVPSAQLPPAIANFIGRDAELSALDSLVDVGGVVVVSGTAGVGKTALTIHWAHRVADRFPDGQLYVNLRGFDPVVTPAAPERAVRGFLEALGVPTSRMPSDMDGLVGLYRTMVAGRRLLVVLDNARDADQVRPLLPGAPGCLAVVTSRGQLTPLVVTDGARPVNVDLLSPDEARDLLARRLGPRRVEVDPVVADEIVTRCARLPLALAIVSARAAMNPRIPLAVIAAELRDLDAFDGGDEATDVRAVFSWSCRTLSPAGARLFRLLSLHPGPDVSIRTAASLAGVEPERIGPLLQELTCANLLTEHTHRRYTFHDLLRAYAASLAEEVEPPDERRAAVGRLLDHYLRTAHAADVILHPHFSEISLPPAPTGSAPERPKNRSEATAWFIAENAGLLAAVPLAAQSGFEGHAWRLAWTIEGFLSRHGHWPDWLCSARIALAAAARIDDRAGKAHVQRGLGLACSRLGRHDEAEEHLRRALILFAVCRDDAGQAHTYLCLGQVTERQGRHREALGHSRRALALFQRAGCRAGHAYTLNAVGWGEALLGNHHQALESCEEALRLLQEVDDVQGQADTWDSLGYAHHHLGNFDRAIACYENALELFRQVRDRYAEASTYVNIGGSLRAVADPVAAHAAWCRAHAILTELGHVDADRVRADLDELEAATDLGELVGVAA